MVSTGHKGGGGGAGVDFVDETAVPIFLEKLSISAVVHMLFHDPQNATHTCSRHPLAPTALPQTTTTAILRTDVHVGEKTHTLRAPPLLAHAVKNTTVTDEHIDLRPGGGFGDQITTTCCEELSRPR